MPNNILITGATGYLAGPLAVYLSEKLPDHNFILGSRSCDRLKSVDALRKFECRYFDIGNSNSFEHALCEIDVVMHLAAMGAKACADNPDLAEFINVHQVDSLLVAAEKSAVKKFIYFSTVHVYGFPLYGVLSEITQTNPQSVYAKTHFSAEQLVLISYFGKNHSGVVLRLSNVIAHPIILEGEAEQLVTISACRQAMVNHKICLNSSGDDYRDFVSLNKLGDFIVKILSKHLVANEFIFNVGSGDTIRVIDLIRSIQSICVSHFGFKPSIILGQKTNPKLPIFKLNVELIDSILGKTEKEEQTNNSLSEILKKTLTYFSNQ